MKKYLNLFFVMAKVGVCMFGGGYAMLPILQRELVEKRGWATDDQLADYYAVGQCTPGVIAINTATFVGSSQGGIIGGVVATLGLVFPPLLIILLVASVLQNLMHIECVLHAFAGIRATVIALILNSVIKLFPPAVKDWPTRVIYLLVLVFAVIGAFADLQDGSIGAILCSPAVLVLTAGLAGLCVRMIKRRAKK